MEYPTIVAMATPLPLLLQFCVILFADFVSGLKINNSTRFQPVPRPPKNPQVGKWALGGGRWAANQGMAALANDKPCFVDVVDAAVAVAAIKSL